MLAEILTAICLVLVLEGILPFLNPAGFKRVMNAIQELPDSQLRMMGLSSMIVGVILLAIVR